MRFPQTLRKFPVSVPVLAGAGIFILLAQFTFMLARLNADLKAPISGVQTAELFPLRILIPGLAISLILAFITFRVVRKIYDFNARTRAIQSGLYDYITRGSSLAIFVSDENRLILETNENFSQITGMSHQSMKGRPYYSCLGLTAPVFSEAEAHKIRAGENQVKQIMLRQTDGSFRELELSTRKIYDKIFFTIVRDTTHGSEFHHLIEKSESTLRTAFEQSGVGLALIASDFCWVKVNKTLCTLLGYEETELLGGKFDLLIHPDDRSEVNSQLAEMMGGKNENAVGTIRFIHRSGKHIWIKHHITIVRSEGKIPLYFVSQFENFSEQYEAEMKFRNLVEKTSIGVYIIQDDVFNYINPAFTKLTGYSEEDVIGKMKIEDLIIPDDLPLSLKQQLHPEEQQQKAFEARCLQKNGSTIWIEVLGSATLIQGRPAIIGTFQDITDRKQSTAAILHEKSISETIINGLPGIFYIADLNGNLVRWNKNFEHYSGHRADEIVGKRTLDFIPRRYHQKIQQSWKNMHEHGVLNELEIPVVTKNGNEIPYYLTVMPFTYDGAKSEIGIGYDISSRVKIENSLKKRNQEVRKRVKELNSLIRITEIANNDLKSMDDILHECVRILPIAYQYPEIASVRISIRGKVYTSAAFEESNWKQEAPIVISGKNSGSIEVYYSELRNTDSQDPFLPEERYLINSVAETISSAIGKRDTAEVLHKSEEKYHYLYDHNPAYIIIWDPEKMEIIEANAVACEIYGYSPEEWKGKPIYDIRPREDHELIRIFAENFRSGKTMKARRTWRHLKKNGDMIYMDITSLSIDYNGRKAIYSLGKDITELYLAEKEQKKLNEDVRRLNTHLHSIREEERANIAREIHDEIGQQLTGLKMYISSIFRHINPNEEQALQKSAEVMKMFDDLVVSIRRISSELRPSLLDDFGLVAALETLSADFQKRSGINVHAQFKFSEKQILKEHAIAIYRICQESLTNVMRHAQAKDVFVSIIEENTKIIISIRDTGKGFDAEKINQKKTLGLLGMRERTIMIGGEIALHSREGEGTTVTVEIPCAS